MRAVKGKAVPSQREIAAFSGAACWHRSRWHGPKPMLCLLPMTIAYFPSLATLAVFGALSAACADNSGRYPTLSARDFDRVQGQFEASSSERQVLLPEPMSLSEVAQLREAIAVVRTRHSRFLTQAETARGLVHAARGTGPEDKNWSLALVAIAELDSQAGATTGLLADLDKLYTAASLEFHEREQISAAQTEAAALVEAENQIIHALAAQLGTPPRAPAPQD